MLSVEQYRNALTTPHPDGEQMVGPARTDTFQSPDFNTGPSFDWTHHQHKYFYCRITFVWRRLETVVTDTFQTTSAYKQQKYPIPVNLLTLHVRLHGAFPSKLSKTQNTNNTQTCYRSLWPALIYQGALDRNFCHNYPSQDSYWPFCFRCKDSALHILVHTSATRNPAGRTNLANQQWLVDRLRVTWESV